MGATLTNAHRFVPCVPRDNVFDKDAANMLQATLSIAHAQQRMTVDVEINDRSTYCMSRDIFVPM